MQGIEMVGESAMMQVPDFFPSVSMMDWETGRPNARYWALKLLRELWAGRQAGEDLQRSARSVCPSILGKGRQEEVASGEHPEPAGRGKHCRRGWGRAGDSRSDHRFQSACFGATGLRQAQIKGIGGPGDCFALTRHIPDKGDEERALREIQRCPARSSALFRKARGSLPERDVQRRRSLPPRADRSGKAQ